MNPLALLRSRFATALAAFGDDAPAFADMVRPSQDAKFGDYQANCAMPLGKKLGKSPRDVAAELVEAIDVADLCEPPEIAGPGFINLKLKDDWLTAALSAARADDDRLAVEPAEPSRTVVIDYSSPNVAKPMHVGHIRSTVIGDALASVLGFLGHNVITDNHIGDWGTQFGMIIYGWKNFANHKAFAGAPADKLVPELTRLYRLVNAIGDYQTLKADRLPQLAEQITAAKMRLAELQSNEPTGDAKKDKRADKLRDKTEKDLKNLQLNLELHHGKLTHYEVDPEFIERAKEHPEIGARALVETAKLHEGDTENRALWERFLPACMEEIEKTYARLNVTFDHTLGESFYQPMLAGVVESLRHKQIAIESEGAIIVPAERLYIDGNEAPFLVRKQDGAFLYATTDLATIQWRMKEWRPDAILYVVDHRQSLHFDQLFATAEIWNYGIHHYDDDGRSIELQHIAFGTVLGEDGRPFKTRSGSSVGLMGLLDEAVTRAKAIADKSDVLESDDERATVAERIGIGAIKYADLAHNRESDYTFSYDKMLAMQGNTAAYMQYSCARVRGIFTRGGVDVAALRASDAKLELNEPAERALGVALIQFAEALDRVAADYKPNHLTSYLFDLAGKYFDFYEKCPVLKAESDEIKSSRLLLCDLTARTLEKGLGLLGIEVVTRM